MLGNARSSDAVALDTGFFCVTVIFVVRLSVFRLIDAEMYVMVIGGDDEDDVGFTEDTRLFCVTVVCVCMYVRNAVGQMCSRSSMICQARYGFRFFLCQNPYVS